MFSFGSSCGLSFISDSEIELIISLNFAKSVAWIRTPAFVKPVYRSLVTNSRIVRPRFPPKSSILITMSEVIDYMIQTNTVTNVQLQRLTNDYRKFERWDMPDFAK